MEAGDICPDCETIGVPGALCPRHAAADEVYEHARWVVRLYGTDHPKGLAELREHMDALRRILPTGK